MSSYNGRRVLLPSSKLVVATNFLLSSQLVIEHTMKSRLCGLRFYHQDCEYSWAKEIEKTFTNNRAFICTRNNSTSAEYLANTVVSDYNKSKAYKSSCYVLSNITKV